LDNNREVHGKLRLDVSVKQLFGVWPPSMLRDSVVLLTRPRATLPAMITMRKSAHGFPFLSHMGIGLRLAALRALLSDDLKCLLFKALMSCMHCYFESIFHQFTTFLTFLMSFIVLVRRLYEKQDIISPS